MRVSGLIDAIVSPTSLKWRAIQTGILQFFGTGVRFSLRLIGNLILVQFLLPEAFGLMATITLLHLALGLLSDVGLLQSIIREKDGENPEFLCIVWTVKVIRSVFLAAITVLIGVVLLVFQDEIAPTGTVYADEELPLLIIASSIAVVLHGLGSINLLVARRRLQIAQVIRFEMAVGLVTVTTTTLFAIWTQSVWALLLGTIITAAVACVLSFTWIDGPRMRLVFNRAEMKRLWNFGRWVILSSVFGFVMRNADRIVLSINIGAGPFSLYVIAYNWIEAANGILSRVFGSVVMPASGELIREQRPDLKKKLQFLFLIQAFVSVATLLTMPFLIELLVLYAFPEEYLGAISFLSLIALSFYHFPTGTYGMIATTLGNSRLVGLINMVVAPIAVFLIWFSLDRFGTEAAILAYSITPVIQSQILYVAGALWTMIGWHINLLWLCGLAVLSYLHFTWYVL